LIEIAMIIEFKMSVQFVKEDFTKNQEIVWPALMLKIVSFVILIIHQYVWFVKVLPI
jgi:hypothetical protein